MFLQIHICWYWGFSEGCSSRTFLMGRRLFCHPPGPYMSAWPSVERSVIQTSTRRQSDLSTRRWVDDWLLRLLDPNMSAWPAVERPAVYTSTQPSVRRQSDATMGRRLFTMTVPNMSTWPTTVYDVGRATSDSDVGPPVISTTIWLFNDVCPTPTCLPGRRLRDHRFWRRPDHRLHVNHLLHIPKPLIYSV